MVAKPSIERMAETLDKFEEDVLRKGTATIKARRSAKVRFGEPLEVVGDRKVKGQTTTLTTEAEKSVQSMLEKIAHPPGCADPATVIDPALADES